MEAAQARSGPGGGGPWPTSRCVHCVGKSKSAMYCTGGQRWECTVREPGCRKVRDESRVRERSRCLKSVEAAKQGRNVG